MNSRIRCPCVAPCGRCAAITNLTWEGKRQVNVSKWSVLSLIFSSVSTQWKAGELNLNTFEAFFFFLYFNEIFCFKMFYIFFTFWLMNTEHVKKRYKKRKGKLNIIHRRLTHNYILTKKKTNETKTQYLLFYLHEKKSKIK